MAPIKFEEHVKAQLEKREITPSAGSWEKLNGRIDKSKGKSNRKFWLAGVAAVLVIILSGSLFINLQKQSTGIPIVDKQPEIPEILEDGQYQDNKEIVSGENESEEEFIKKSEKEQTLIASKEKLEKPESKNEKEIYQEVAEVRSQREILEPISINPEKFTKAEESLISKELNELIASTFSEKGKMTEEEVGVLLLQAADKITDQNNIRKGSLSAADLLAEVESEIDQSFRREVFEFLKEEFVKARTAFVSRNN